MTMTPVPRRDNELRHACGGEANAPSTRDLRLPVGAAGETIALRLAVPAEPAHGADDLAVLYLHGFGSAQVGEKATYFRRRFLDAGVALASIDFRGHGQSDGTLFDLSLSRNLEDIACARRFVHASGYRRVILFGSSVGGASALWHTTQDAKPSPEDDHPGDIVAAIQIAPALDLRAQLEASLGTDGMDRWRRDGRMLLPHERTPAEIAWTMMEDLARYATPDLASRYGVPSLIFQGKGDTSVSWRAVLDFVDACAAPIELHLMTDGDHRLVDRLDHLWRLAHSFLVARSIIDERTRVSTGGLS